MSKDRCGRIGSSCVVLVAVAALAACSSSSSSGGGGGGGAAGRAGSGGAGGSSPGGHAGTTGGGAGGVAGAAAGGAGGAGGTAGAAAAGGGMTTGSAGVGGAAGTGGGGGDTIGGGGNGGTTATGGAGGGTTGSGGAGGAAAPTTCGPGTYGGGETALALSSATAAAVDETGALVVGQPALICGLDICSAPGTTGSNGKVTITTTLTPKKPALRLGDALNYAEITVPLTMATTDLSAGGQTLTLGKLSNKPGAALTPGTTATSGAVALTLATGTTVEIDTLEYDTSDAQMFRAVSIPVAGLAPWLGTVQLGGAPAGFALYYGLAPAETTFCPPVKVAVSLPHATASPNDLGWAPGTAVEFWITSTDVGQQYAPYAGWRKMSDGVVSSDGATITTPAGQGFSILENFAVRKAP